MRQINHLKSSQDLFAYIPPELIIEILSRLPVQTIMSCKCVCKSWLALLDSHEFVKYHLIKPIQGLAIYRFSLGLYKLFDFEDGLDLEYHDLHYRVTKFKMPSLYGWISGSANGLLFLLGIGRYPLYVCNPITRDYIQLDCNEFVQSQSHIITYGFGYTKITGQHKVVRISHKYVSAARNPHAYVQGGIPNFECVCHVYTVGTRLWRRITHVAHLVYDRCNDGAFLDGAFLNGNLHWPVSDFEVPQLLISCIDLETEHISTFSSPLLKTAYSVALTILGECLCLCDYGQTNGIAIWLMKEYGVEKSWVKQFFIAIARQPQQGYYKPVYPIKIFKDGDILLVWHIELRYYSKKYNSVEKIAALEYHKGVNAYPYTPSFLSLKNFAEWRG